MNCRHGEQETVADHIRNIKNLSQMIKHYHGTIVNFEPIMEEAKKNDEEAGRPPKLRKNTENGQKIKPLL